MGKNTLLDGTTILGLPAPWASTFKTSIDCNLWALQEIHKGSFIPRSRRLDAGAAFISKWERRSSGVEYIFTFQ